MSFTRDLHLDSFSGLIILSKSTVGLTYSVLSLFSISLLSLFSNDYYLVSLLDIADNLSRIFLSNLLFLFDTYCSVFSVAF